MTLKLIPGMERHFCCCNKNALKKIMCINRTPAMSQMGLFKEMRGA